MGCGDEEENQDGANPNQEEVTCVGTWEVELDLYNQEDPPPYTRIIFPAEIMNLEVSDETACYYDTRQMPRILLTRPVLNSTLTQGV